jgi:DNA modification methylase
MHREIPNVVDQAFGDDWALYHGDSISVLDGLPDDSVGLVVTSPPFPGMYAYTNSAHDMGNSTSIDQLMEHYRYLVAPDKLLRVMKPGRSAAIHLTQSVAFKGTDGYIGLKDFRGRVIQEMEAAGWIYYGEVTIDKNPQVKAIRTKDRGLLFKTLATDSSHMHMALADYLLQFRKPGDNVEPIRAGISEKYDNADGWITADEWIEWAAPVWYRADAGIPGGIRETDVLNVVQARETDDERHLAPLQLGVIERAVKLWSNPGDIVLDPFNGIGSSGYVSLKLRRRYIGIELKRSYWQSAIANLKRAEQEREQVELPLFAGEIAS